MKGSDIMLKQTVCALAVAGSLLGGVCSANGLHDLQDAVPPDKALHFVAGYIISDQLQRNAGMSPFEAFLATSALAWAKEKYVDDHVDNGDAYSTMAGAAFYEVKF